MSDRMSICELRPVRNLYDGDLYEVGRVVLQANAARAPGRPGRGYPTVNGLARSYARLLSVAPEPFVDSVREQGFPLGAMVVDDGSIPV